jgi:hypothetical protein
MRKGSQAPAMTAEAWKESNGRLTRSLTSPTTLSDEGFRESLRILGTNSSLGAESFSPSASASRPRDLVPIDRSKLSETTNQLYGSRPPMPEESPVFHPKNTCDVCRFQNSMIMTGTRYAPNIRF